MHIVPKYFEQLKTPKYTWKEAYRALITVKPEEFKQRLHALLVMEEFGWKMAVEELHAIPNGLVQSWTRERGIKRFKVQLKHEVSVSTASRGRETVKLSWHAQQQSEYQKKLWTLPSLNKLLLETQILSRT